MTVLVSDANIFIDVEVANLTRHMFRLDETFATPDILYLEELQAHHPDLPGLGLRIERVGAGGMAELQDLKARYVGSGFYDLLALALAKERAWPLLTGDARLRTAADQEGVEVHGTLWLVERMVTSRLLKVDAAALAFQRMRDQGRRLPWDEVEQLLTRLGP